MTYPGVPPFAQQTFRPEQSLEGPWLWRILAGGMMSAITAPARAWFSLAWRDIAAYVVPRRRPARSRRRS